MGTPESTFRCSSNFKAAWPRFGPSGPNHLLTKVQVCLGIFCFPRTGFPWIPPSRTQSQSGVISPQPTATSAWLREGVNVSNMCWGPKPGSQAQVNPGIAQVTQKWNRVWKRKSIFACGNQIRTLRFSKVRIPSFYVTFLQFQNMQEKPPPSNTHTNVRVRSTCTNTQTARTCSRARAPPLRLTDLP